ncbi:MAG: transcription antitermination factor NusB [Planctomycetota bacterium]
MASERAHGPNPRRIALQALTEVESGRASRLQNALTADVLAGLDERDRAFARELSQGTERQHLLLDFVLSQLVAKELPRDPEVLSALRLGAYQLMFLWRVQAHAAVHETVALIPHHKGFLNAVLRNLARRIRDGGPGTELGQRALALPGATGPRTLLFDEPVLPPKNTPERLSVLHGLPSFLVARWFENLGPDGARQACEASSATPTMTLRPTHRAGGGAVLAAKLAAEGVTTRPLGEGELLVWEGGSSPLAGQAFGDGWLMVQGPAARAAAAAVAAQPGECVLDLCAAPGTKTVCLAEAVGPEGRVLAVDTDHERRRKIGENIRRVGVEQQVLILDDQDALRTLPTPSATIHRALVDAPCSNTGVLARRLEVRRRISVTAIQELARAQAELLRQGLAHCRGPRSRVVYSTCSLEPEENQEVVAAVVSPSWRLAEERLTLPRAPTGDGGYFAILEGML